ncbi:MAG: TIGR03790 family protein, partial [Deltaproteobacteria bacterium]
HAFDSLEIQEILLRLTGIAPAAEALAAQTEMRRPETRQLLGAAPVLQMHKVLQAQLGRILFQGVTAKSVLSQAAAAMMDKGLIGELQFWLSPEVQAKAGETGAAVDSELSMLLAPHSLQRWLPNPFLKKYDRYPRIKEIRDSTLLVARLDGPTPEIAKRLVDDAVEVEEKGLTGTFYIDARGLSAKTNYYGMYDRHLRNLAEILAKQTTFPVVFDDRPGLFREKSCHKAALYCGWYSLARYQDSFDWRKGAVGFHVASSEAATLRQPGSQVWCKRMLEEGVAAATLGPVDEPYLQSFPLPDKFFPLLMTGKLALVEVYYRTLPFLSWRQILIGDPLYRPFRKNPVFTE